MHFVLRCGCRQDERFGISKQAVGHKVVLTNENEIIT